MSELLDNADTWTRCAYARNAQGHPVEPHDPAAVRWCLWGAAEKCGCLPDFISWWRVQPERATIGSPSIWQDCEDRTFAQVRDLIMRFESAQEVQP